MNKILFSEWAKMWLESVHGTVKENTFEATYRNSVENHLVPEFGNKTMDKIKPIELQVFLNKSAERYSVDTVKKFKSCLKQMFDDAVFNDYCDKNPAYKLKIYKAVKTSQTIEDRIYTPQQIELIETYALKHRFGLDILLLLETGMRRGEMLGLTWDNVDFTNKAIYIKQAVAIVRDNGIITTNLGTPKNNSSVRAIPISTEFTEYLASIKRRSTSPYVVHNKNNNVLNPRTWQRRHYDVFMSDMHDEYIKVNIDIPVYTPHRLRHSRASCWVNGGINLYAVAKTLGHSNLEMLKKRYAHSNLEEVRNLLRLQ